MKRGKMNFGQTLKHLKRGGTATRSGWNGRGMYIGLNPGEVELAGDELLVGDHFAEREMLPYIFMSTVDGRIVPWVASHTDMLAEDWKKVRRSKRGRPCQV